MIIMQLDNIKVYLHDLVTSNMMVSISTFAFSLIHRYKFSPGVECEVLAGSGWRSLLGTISARCGNPP